MLNTVTKMTRPGLALETLEERANPSSAIVNGHLQITGTPGNDVISISTDTIAGVPLYRVTQNGATNWHLASKVTSGTIDAYGNDGHDYITNYVNSLRLVADGGAGNDQLVGAALNDDLNGGAGSDRLYGEGGHDTLRAGRGLFGGNAADAETDVNSLVGGEGWDTFWGSRGSDRMYGLAGNDVMYGLGGPDYMYGGADRDYLSGGHGSDTLDGGRDFVRDTLFGNEGYDTFFRDMVQGNNVDHPADYNVNEDDIDLSR